jgi:hypothetical protein
MPDKTWIKIAGGGGSGLPAAQAGSRIIDVGPSPAPPGSEGITAVFNDWTGGCANQSLGEYYLPAQGGHDGYWGNEIYALALRTATPGWQRIWGPTPNAQISTNETGYNNVNMNYSDGSPKPMHGWFTCFVDNNNRIWVTASDANPSGSWATTVYSINRNSLSAGWMYHGRLYPAIPGGAPGSSFGCNREGEEGCA